MNDDELKLVRYVNDELERCAAEVRRLRFWRMQLVRSLLHCGTSEWHIAELLGASPAEVREWAWRNPHSTHNFTCGDRETPGESDQTKRETAGQSVLDRSYKAEVVGSRPTTPTDITAGQRT